MSNEGRKPDVMDKTGARMRLWIEVAVTVWVLAGGMFAWGWTNELPEVTRLALAISGLATLATIWAMALWVVRQIVDAITVTAEDGGISRLLDR